jgi:hypothetical protein
MLRIDYHSTTSRCDGVSRCPFIQASAYSFAGHSLGLVMDRATRGQPIKELF